ncbi:MAG: winged helix-turn-helix domain-containing protein [Nanobdellota archaeon]
MQERSVTIDMDTLKALSVDARLSVLKALSGKKMTQSELSEEIGLSAATLHEHLSKLQSAGLIEKEETDRKWKYYSLTRKGKDIVEPRERTVIFSLFALLLVGAWSGYLFLRQFFVNRTEAMESDIRTLAAETAPASPELAWGFVFFVALLLIGACAGYLLKKRYMR